MHSTVFGIFSTDDSNDIVFSIISIMMNEVRGGRARGRRGDAVSNWQQLASPIADALGSARMLPAGELSRVILKLVQSLCRIFLLVLP